MSFILDALKKSEIERQRQSVPGLMDARSNPRRSRLPVWAIALGALLAVNLLVLTFVLMRRNAPASLSASAPGAASAALPSASRAGEPASAPPVGDAPPEAAHFSPLDAAPVYAPEIPVAPSGSSAPRRSPMRTDPGAQAVRPVHHPDPVLTDEDAKAESREVLPTLSEISLTGAHALPELHLDVHVYATNPAERFVYINARKYHEGAVLQDGPAIERIRRDGVVLSYQGLRFILPRQP
jgi:general secretion pathway protein B